MRRAGYWPVQQPNRECGFLCLHPNLWPACGVPNRGRGTGGCGQTGAAGGVFADRFLSAADAGARGRDPDRDGGAWRRFSAGQFSCSIPI